MEPSLVSIAAMLPVIIKELALIIATRSLRVRTFAAPGGGMAPPMGPPLGIPFPAAAIFVFFLSVLSSTLTGDVEVPLFRTFLAPVDTGVVWACDCDLAEDGVILAEVLLWFTGGVLVVALKSLAQAPAACAVDVNVAAGLARRSLWWTSDQLGILQGNRR